MASRLPSFFTKALLATALLGTGSVYAADAVGIVVYNAQHESLTKAWVEGFTQETGIPVTIRNGDDTEMGNQIVQEGAASPADVFLTENSPAMVLVDNAGLFAPVAPTTLEQVDAAYRPAHGKWVGIAARSTVFVYNPSKLKEADLPKSLLDLASPSWKGRWAASPAGADFQAIVAAVLELKGEAATLDWLKAMKANASIYRGNSAVLKAVNAGQVDSGVDDAVAEVPDVTEDVQHPQRPVRLARSHGEDPAAVSGVPRTSPTSVSRAIVVTRRSNRSRARRRAAAPIRWRSASSSSKRRSATASPS